MAEDWNLQATILPLPLRLRLLLLLLLLVLLVGYTQWLKW